MTSNVEELVAFLVAFIDLQRRRLCKLRTGSNCNVLPEMDRVIEQCIQIRSRHFDQPDPLFKLERYAGWMHAQHASMEKCRAVWEGVMKGHANEAAFWLEYIFLEKYR